MRPPTAALAALTAAAALLVGWQEGARPHTATLPGVHVVAGPPTAKAPTGAPVGRKARSSGKTGSGRPSHSAAESAPANPRRTIDGALIGTPYGNVQVSIVVVGHRITDVRALHLTDANGRSRQISAGAAPVLRREALDRQSARIDTVSGATYTSQGYTQSLQAALDQAHL